MPDLFYFRPRLLRFGLVLIALLSLNLLANGQVRRFVKAGASGDGLAWATASGDLQAMIDASGVQEVWVATGTYKPTNTTDRTISFALKNGVTVYGGFAATGTPTLSQRNPGLYPTTLSGEIGSAGLSNNSYHVIFNTGLDNTAILDGFVITAGNANGSGSDQDAGGGIRSNNGNPIVRNCLFRGNSATYGGAFYSQNNGNPTLANCSFQSNTATIGGGAVYVYDDSPLLINCSFQSNTAPANSGGAINSGNGNSPSLTNCVLFGNGGANTISTAATPVSSRFSLFDATVTGYTSVTGNLTTSTTPFSSATATQLLTCAPAINTGDPTTTSATVGTIDLAGNARFFAGGRIDMGAYELQSASSLTVSLSASPSTTLSCAQTSLTLTATGGTSYTFSGPGVVSQNATAGTAVIGSSGTYTVVSSVTSACGTVVASNTIAISNGPGSVSVTNPSVSTATVGVAFSQTFTASGSTPPYTFSLAIGTLPTGLSLSTSGVLSGPPSQTGTFVISVRGTSNSNCSSLGGTYSLFVSAAPPSLGTYTSQSAVQGSNLSLTPSAAPGGTSRLNVSTPPAFRGTLVASPTTGVVRVTNAHPAGVYTLTLTAFGTGSPASSTVSLSVTTGTACPESLSITAAADVTGLPLPVGVAVGDVNNDGRQDLVIANAVNNPVAIRLGNGSGGFTGSTTVAVGNNPASVGVADLNNDGNLDFVTVNQGAAGTVSVRLGDGAGNFSAANDLTGMLYPTNLAISDLNNDHHPDLLVATADRVSVWLGDGQGGFSAGTDIGSIFSFNLATGDLNRDGRTDIAVANSDGTLDIRLGDGAGGFTNPAIPTLNLSSEALQGVAIGDLNNDGNPDVVVTGRAVFPSTSGELIRLLGNGSGGFGSPSSVTIGQNQWTLVLGDLNRDGNLDAAVGNIGGGANTVSIRLGNGAGDFTSPPTPEVIVGSGPQGLALGDFNQDGRLDFVTANAGGTTASVRLGGCGGTPPTITAFAPTPRTVACPGSLVTFTATVGSFTGTYSFTLTNGSSTTTGTRSTTAFSQSWTTAGYGVQTFTLTVGINGLFTTASTALTVGAAISNTAINHWHGCVGTNWQTPGNWSKGTVPIATEDVVVLVTAINQPTLNGTGTANSVELPTNTTLTIGSSGTLTINGFRSIDGINTGFRNNGLVNTSGNLLIPSGASGTQALRNQGTFNNLPGSRLVIDRSGDLAFSNASGATFVNSGSVSIGATVGGSNGFFNSATAINQAGGYIAIDRTSARAFFNQFNSSFANSGTLIIGGITSGASQGIENQARFVNQTGGLIRIDRLNASANGIANTIGSFVNSGTINIGSSATLGQQGIASSGSFTNTAGGLITIDRTTNSGLFAGSSFVNSGTITIGASGPVGVYSLETYAVAFRNLACGILNLHEAVSLLSSTTFVNQGLMVVSTTTTHSNSGTLTNQGVISYLLGNPIPDVINEGIIALPLVLCGQSPYSPALQLGGSNTLTVGSTWFTNVGQTVPAGSYSPNTFTPNLAGGTAYTLSFPVTDGGNSCGYSVPLSVTVNPTPSLTLTASGNGGLSSNTLTCAQSSLTLTVTSGAVGAPTGYTFSGPGLSQSGTSTTAVVNQAGVYSVTAINASGCSSVVSTTIGSNTTLTGFGVIASASVCAGTGSVTLSASGCTGGTVNWPGGITGNTFSTSVAGTYTATCTVGACTTTASGTATVGTAVTATLSASGGGTLTCSQTSLTLTATGGTSYTFSGPGLNQSGALATAVVSQTGTYSVRVANASGCTSVTSVSISAAVDLPTVSLAASNSLNCAVTSATLTATATGVGSLTYAFRNSSGLLLGSPSANSTVAVSQGGSYSVLVTAANGCTVLQSTSVANNTTAPIVSISATSGTLTCAVTSITLTATSSGTGLLWSNAATTQSITVNSTGTYSVTATGGAGHPANGCSAVSNTITIGQNNTAPTGANISASNSGTLTCSVQTLTLTATATGSSLSYVFAGPAGTLAGSGNTRPVSATGLYSVTITGANGCTTTASTTVFSNTTAPTVGLISSGTITCSIPTVTLTASVGVGLPGVTYRFSGPSVVSSLGNQATVNVGGTYSVTVLNPANGCFATNTVSVSSDLGGAPPAPTLSASSSVVCAGSNVLVVATVGGSPSGLQWYRNGQAVAGQTSATLLLGGVQVGQAGQYVLAVPGACSATSASFTLTVNPLPTVTLSFPTGSTVVGPGTGVGTITLPAPLTGVAMQAFGGVLYERLIVIDRINGYEIRGVDSNTNGLFTVTRTGPFRVTVTDANSCRRTVEGTVVVRP